MIDITTYCPSTPVIDLETGKQIGWWYAMHIRPEGDVRTECPVCGKQFAKQIAPASNTNNGE